MGRNPCPMPRPLLALALHAAWSEAPSYRPPREAGTVVFKLTNDGQTLDGRWRYGIDGPDDPTPWRGDRLPATPGDGWTVPTKVQHKLIFEW